MSAARVAALLLALPFVLGNDACFRRQVRPGERSVQVEGGAQETCVTVVTEFDDVTLYACDLPGETHLVYVAVDRWRQEAKAAASWFERSGKVEIERRVQTVNKEPSEVIP